MEDLEQRHVQQTDSMQTELKQEMGLLQKKMLMDTVEQLQLMAVDKQFSLLQNRSLFSSYSPFSDALLSFR